jgi:short-subunit dehydrogenase
MFQLRGSTVLLTGASRGIGAVLATRVADEGAHLLLAARDAQKLESVRADCAARNVSVRVVVADVSQRADRERLAREAGEIDVLINNAGIEATEALTNQTLDEIDAQVVTNLIAPIALTRLVLPAMLARRRGVVVNVSSMSGKGATPFNAVYAATKFGLNGFTASLRLELEGTGVHVGVVCPSFVGRTGMWADTGRRAPALMREVSPEKVVSGVLAVIRGAPEVLVTPGPIRPMLALRELFPRIEGPALRFLGVYDAMKNRTRREKPE